MGEALDDGGRDDRRIGSVAPHSLERRVAGTDVLAVDDEDVPLHDVLRPGTGSRQGRAQVAQDLLGLLGARTFDSCRALPNTCSILYFGRARQWIGSNGAGRGDRLLAVGLSGRRSATATNPASDAPARIGTAALAARGGRTSSKNGTGSPIFACSGPIGQSPPPTISPAPSIERKAMLAQSHRSRRRVAAQTQM